MEFFLHGVAVEPGCSTQSAGDGRAGAAAGFQIAGETLDVRTAGLKQAHVMLLAPARELAQIQLVRVAGQAAIASQEAG
jgi:hypothetical protein